MSRPMIKPYEPPTFETVRMWRGLLLEVIEKVETLPPSELQTSIVSGVAAVSGAMQDVLMDYEAYDWRSPHSTEPDPDRPQPLALEPTYGVWCSAFDGGDESGWIYTGLTRDVAEERAERWSAYAVAGKFYVALPSLGPMPDLPVPTLDPVITDALGALSHGTLMLKRPRCFHCGVELGMDGIPVPGFTGERAVCSESCMFCCGSFCSHATKRIDELQERVDGLLRRGGYATHVIVKARAAVDDDGDRLQCTGELRAALELFDKCHGGPTFGIWCIEDGHWCGSKVYASQDAALRDLPEWQSGQAALVDPRRFRYEVREMGPKGLQGGPVPLKPHEHAPLVDGTCTGCDSDRKETHSWAGCARVLREEVESLSNALMLAEEQNAKERACRLANEAELRRADAKLGELIALGHALGQSEVGPSADTGYCPARAYESEGKT